RPLSTLPLCVIAVRTPAVVTIESDAVVIVPYNGREPLAVDALGHIVWTGSVTDEISETVGRIRVLRLDVGEDSLKRVGIAVNVAEDGEAHHGCPGVQHDRPGCSGAGRQHPVFF